ncbi:hypothetical protein Ping_1637 [Psychromonas ingrahamii 37]|uniref:DUF1574 domain-containing protein n=1 Tax=Psychromonas ingrahamii (strain DSM 17664 / CCUG 51855 / 37) TaxID=357804 RepID=A1SVB7_PSYIN|nr:hypothetical protein [Psychromonas ingrahamii]ABM03432.1 hypothetical protein Ping_1637 [Psychromonas ingrahamii 37]
MNSKKWIKILLILCVLGVGFISGVNYLVDPIGLNNKVLINNINTKKYSNTLMTTRFKANILGDGNFDTIMLGTSRIGVMNPNIVNKHLNSNAFNLEYPGSNTVIQNKFFKYANHFNDIKYLIYAIDFIAFNENITIKNNFHDFYKLEKEIDNFDEIDDFDLYFNIETFIKSVKIVIKNILNIQQTEVIYLSENGMRDYRNYIEENEKGTFKLDENIKKSISYSFSKNSITSYKSYKFSYEYLEYFKNTIDYCNRNNIKFFVYIPPMYSDAFDAINSVGQFDEFELFKKELVKITDYIDFTGHNKISENKNNYWDYGHLRVETTEQIMARIFNNKSIDLPENSGVLVTKENIDEHLENLRKQVKDYDLEKI